MTNATAAALTVGTWSIDQVHSSIYFSVRHLVVGKVRASFGAFNGAITVAEDGSPSVTAEIDVTSVHTGNPDLEARIKSADFFNAEQFPTATFRSTLVRVNGDGYVVEGEFTLKGITKPISLALEFNGVNPGIGHGEVAGFDSSVVLNRKDFGIDIDMPLETGGSATKSPSPSRSKPSSRPDDRGDRVSVVSDRVLPHRHLRSGHVWVVLGCHAQRSLLPGP